MGKVIVNRVYRESVSQALEKGFKDSPIPILNVLDRPSWDGLLQLVQGKLSGEDFQLVT